MADLQFASVLAQGAVAGDRVATSGVGGVELPESPALPGEEEEAAVTVTIYYM